MTVSHKLESQLPDNDEIDLRQVVASLFRQRKLVGGITAAAVLFSGIYAFTRKPVWEGQFEIVLETQTSTSGGRLSQIAASNPVIAGLAGINGSEGSLATEIRILKSPSVLKPTYEFIKAKKAAAGEDISEWYYSDWIRDNVDVELVKGTSVLSLTYRDTDESIILPVLQKITNTYQTYSGKDRRRGLIQGVNYLEKEILKLRQQSDISMRAAQAFALNNGLGIQDGMPATIGAAGNGSVEASREAVQNKVNSLRRRIAVAQTSGSGILYKAPQIKANAVLYVQLQELETELQQLSALLTPQDQSIRRMQRERENLISYINQQTIGLLKGELMTAEAELASLTRPREVVLKHRELLRAALRDEKTLAELEEQLQNIKLDQARQTDPWELISTPTVLDRPVAPHKKRIVALGLFSGLVLGSSAALMRDRRSGLVYSEYELKALLPWSMLERLPVSDTNRWQNTAELLAKGPLVEAQSIALIPVGKLPATQLEQLQSALSESLGNRRLLVTQDLLASRSCETQLLVTSLGAPKRQQIKQIREQLALQGTPVAGWLLIDSTMEA